VRGKLNKPVEFGAQLNVSLTGNSLAHVDYQRWDAFHEGLDLVAQVEAYLARYGHYPERVGRSALWYSRQLSVSEVTRHPFCGKAVRPSETRNRRKSWIVETGQSATPTGLFAAHPHWRQIRLGKNGYRLNYIRAKRANTSFAWINSNSIFMIMNLLILERIFFVLCKGRLAGFIPALWHAWEQMFLYLRVSFKFNFVWQNFLGFRLTTPKTVSLWYVIWELQTMGISSMIVIAFVHFRMNFYGHHP